MIKNNLSSIEHVSIYPIISLTIFGIFFVLLICWVLFQKKEHLDTLKNIPLN